jgi:hypothetical protein
MTANSSSLLWLFAKDLFHQILFYFGGVGAVGILIWEKKSEKPIKWGLIFAVFLVCLFVACFQAWIDEHHNAETLITEKSKLTSDSYLLQQKLDAKQSEADWLRDHQQFHVESGSALDPRVASILDRLNKENQTLRSEPGNRLKKGIIDLAKEMVDFFQKENFPYQQASTEMLERQPTVDENARQARWAQQTNKLVNAEQQMDANIRTEMLGNFSPRALTMLEELRTRGESLTGLKDSDISEATRRCSTPSGGSYWGIQHCIERLSVLAQEMP